MKKETIKRIKDHYFEGWERVLDYNHRCTLKSYIDFSLFNMMILVVCYSSAWWMSRVGFPWFSGLATIYSLGACFPMMSMMVRRLHDTGRSGWALLWVFVPVIGLFYLVWVCHKQGDPKSNKYGWT